MSLTSWSMYLNRTSKILRDNTSKILRMSGADMPDTSPLTMYTFNSKEDIAHFATGCDRDVGGLSTVHLDLDESTEHNASIEKPATAKFWGEMKLGVKAGLEGKLRSGYAGFRNKRRPTLFGEMMDDLSWHEYLALRVRLSGHPRTRNSYFVNLQTDGPVTSDLWQHRLYFQRDDGDWEDIFIPFRNFVLTNSGELVDQQMRMMRQKVRSVGISLLGGNSGSEGPYELGIDSIRAVSQEDVTQVPKKEMSDGTPWQRGPL